MTVNRENMEKWINALEMYQGRQARFELVGPDGAMCAMGIGLHTCNPQALRSTMTLGQLVRVRTEFYDWIGITDPVYVNLDVSLKPQNATFWPDSVVQANDYAGQDTWTIAQRLRETYLKDES